MLKERLTIESGGSQMQAYVARPDTGVHPAVIVLEGIYGFDDELRRVTDLCASIGYVALAINYFHRTHPDFHEPYSADGRERGTQAAAGVTKATMLADLEAARDWLHDHKFVDGNRIAAWGFGFGGAAAFYAATVPGIRSSAAFYGQSIAQALPGGGGAPLDDAGALRAPLLLVFGGRDDLISQHDIESISTRLHDEKKKFEVETYANCGHSFFRDYQTSINAREIADAWDRVQAFFRRSLA